MSEPRERLVDQGGSVGTTPAHPILQTKLFVPPTRLERVPRPALIARLNEGLTGKLTLISAPAGFGKTTLMADWLQQLDRPSAWISLDEGDNDSVRLCAYVVAALQRIEPDIGQTVQAMLQAPQPPPQELLLTSLVNDIAKTEHPFVLVLDDYHLIEAQSIHEAITFLLDHVPPQMHLALTSRADPPLPIALLRGRGQLCELYAADLRFSPDEAAAFLNEVMGLALSAEEVAALERRTEGWITGLQLAALSIRGREDVSSFVAAFTGSQRFVLDYLTEEVLNQQSEEIKEFLLQTAILDRLTGPLCDVVRFGKAKAPTSSPITGVRFGKAESRRLGEAESLSTPTGTAVRSSPAVAGRVDSQSILEALDSGNLFIVPLDGERRWYRYHHLFADLLRQRLQRERGDLVPELHRRASNWYEQGGLIPEAVSHALSAGDAERAADLIEWIAWTTVIRGEARTLRGWVDKLPDELTRSRPQLGVLYAWALALGGESESIEPYLQGVEVQQVPGEVAAVRAYVASLHNEMAQATELAQQVLEHLPERKWFSRGLAMLTLGSAAMCSGDPSAAAQTLSDVVRLSKAAAQTPSEVIRLSQAAGRTYLALVATTMLGEVLQMQGQLHEAGETHRQALQLAPEKGDRPAPFAGGLAHVGLSRLLYEWDDLDGAMRHAEKGIELCRLGGLVEAMPVAYLIVAQVHLARGLPDQSAEMIQETAQVAQRLGNDYVQARAAALRMRLWMAHRDRAPAAHWSAQHLPGMDGGTDYFRELACLARARELIASALAADPIQRNRVLRALELLKQQLPAAMAAGRVENSIAILALQARAFQIDGDRDQALSALEHALSLAEPGGYVRIFVDEGEAMACLLRRALTRGIAASYVSRLLTAYGESAAATSPVAQALVEPLTERELEVLRLIAAGLSNQEIAHELVIALSTVKSHVNHIYGKLGVKSRTQAVARGQELDLV